MPSNFKDVIVRLENQKAAIDRALAALREFDDSGVAKRPASTKAATKKAKKRVMSAEARKAIGDAARKRWAAVKKAAKKTAQV